MRRLVAGGGLALALLVLAAPTAGAASLDGGCKGSATSIDEDGNEVDSVSAPGPGGTKSDPFLVDADGTIDYEGTSPEVFHDHSWHVDVGFMVDDGGSENATEQAGTSGTVQVDDYLPVDAVGLYRASGDITADEGSCSGSVWVKVVGRPAGSIGWIAGLVATVLGAVGLAVTALPVLRRGS